MVQIYNRTRAKVWIITCVLWHANGYLCNYFVSNEITYLYIKKLTTLGACPARVFVPPVIRGIALLELSHFETT